MIVNYPSKTFAKEARTALEMRKFFDVVVSGWRAKMLAKEVELWAVSNESTQVGGEVAKSPSFIFNLCNLKLVAFHWFALSAQYKMQSEVSGSGVVLRYIPH